MASEAEADQLRDLFGSDSEEERPTENANDNKKEQADDQQLRDLFGSSDDEEQQQAKTDNEIPPTQQQDQGYQEDQEEYQEEDAPLRGPPMTVTVPLHDVLASDTLRLAKLSNILSIEPLPFDPETHQLESIEYTDERGHKRIRLRDANTIRWRWAPSSDGASLVRESNARLVQWSDGSTTLMVGDEVMDVKEIDVAADQSFLFARHSNLIQGQGRLDRKLVFRPASLKSESHRRLAKIVEQHHSTRQQRVRAMATVVDPTKAKAEREKAEEARIRDKERLAEKQQKQMRRYTAAPSGRSYGSSGQRRGLNAAYLEEDDDEEVGIRYGDEDEEDDVDDFIVRDEDMEEEEDGEEEEEGAAVRRRMVDEDEEDEEEAARRLTAAKSEPPPAVPGRGGSGGGGLVDSDDNDAGDGNGGDKEEVEEPKAKKRRGVVMDSDSE